MHSTDDDHGPGAPAPRDRPIANAYAVSAGALYAGEYPGAARRLEIDATQAKLTAFLDFGIDAFLDLTQAGELASYHEDVVALAAQRGRTLHIERHPIRDLGTTDVAAMTQILDRIDAHRAEGRRVYVHCWGGIGRTGTTIGCWLVRHGAAPEDALARVNALWNSMSEDKLRRNAGKSSPEMPAQIQFVREWTIGA